MSADIDIQKSPKCWHLTHYWHFWQSERISVYIFTLVITISLLMFVFNDHQHLHHASHSSGSIKLRRRNFGSVLLHGGAWGRESVLGDVLLHLTCSRELETRNTSDKKERKEKKHGNEVSFLLDILPPWEQTQFSFVTYTHLLSWPTLSNGSDRHR